MNGFQYDPAIMETFPQIVGGVIIIRNIQNPPTPPTLLERYQAEQAAVKAKIGDTPLSELPTLAAWRRAFSTFGVSPTQYRSAAEALLRRLTKKGDIPSINTLVDIGNLISIRYGVPVAMFDTRAIDGTLTVRFADGTEQFTPLGEAAPEHPDSGEVVFVDDAKRVYARRWCWRQSAESASRADTTSVLVTIEGQHDGALDDIRNAQADMVELLNLYAPADMLFRVLHGRNRQFGVS